VQLSWDLRNLGYLGQPALLTGGSVLVDQTFASGAVEQAHGFQLLVSRGASGARVLEGRTQSRALRPVTDGRRARLAHVFLGGLDIRHEPDSRISSDQVSRETRGPRDGCQGATLL
jgi:hypothetical protein